jgi:hypothetical protein
MEQIRVISLRTFAKTPWGFIGLAQTTLPEINPITLEEARKQNLKDAAERLVPMNFPGIKIRTPTADTTIHVTERLVIHDPMSDEESEMIEALPEYDIEYWRMGG